MTDGPHKSLNMRRNWKKVAEFADNDSSAVEDICAAVGPAISCDWDADVPPGVRKAVCELLGPTQYSLFPSDKELHLDALRPMTEPGGLGHVLIDCAAKAAAGAKTNENASIDATVDALTIWGVRHARQIEEHYHRNCGASRAKSVRGRAEQAILRAVNPTLARQLLRLSDSPAPKKTQRKTSLDDGVKL